MERLRKLTSLKGIFYTLIGVLLLVLYITIAGNRAAQQKKVSEKITPKEGTFVYNWYTGVKLDEASNLSKTVLLIINKDGKASLKVETPDKEQVININGTYTVADSKFVLSTTNRNYAFKIVKQTLIPDNSEAKTIVDNIVLSSPANKSLATTKWAWIESKTGDIVTKPSISGSKVFILTFNENHSFESTTDCNSLSGTFYQGEKSIIFTKIASTLMLCDSRSQESFYLTGLRSVVSYELKDDLLTLKASNGDIMLFRKR